MGVRAAVPAWRLLAAALGALLLSACGGSKAPGPELLGLEGRSRAELEAVYPPGTTRDVVRAREAKPLVFSVHPCNFATRHQDAGLSAAAAAFEDEFPERPLRCDRVRLARTGWVTLVGGLAYYQDYVFYDGEDQVLVTYRTFLQPSAQKDAPVPPEEGAASPAP